MYIPNKVVILSFSIDCNQLKQNYQETINATDKIIMYRYSSGKWTFKVKLLILNYTLQLTRTKLSKIINATDKIYIMHCHFLGYLKWTFKIKFL